MMKGRMMCGRVIVGFKSIVGIDPNADNPE